MSGLESLDPADVGAVANAASQQVRALGGSAVEQTLPGAGKVVSKTGS